MRYGDQIGDIGEASFHLCFDDAGAGFGGVDANGLGRKREIRIRDGTDSRPGGVIRDGRERDERPVDQDLI